MNFPRFVVRVTCCFSLIAVACCLNALGQSPVPRFETSECAVSIPKGETAKCGYLIVPESRKMKNGKTIRLPIVTLKSENPNPQPDPILRTFGGPGASSMNLVRSRGSSPWLKDRDLIIFEQRGTKYAQPALECPEVNDSKINSVRRQLNSVTARKNELQAASACYSRLVNQGINLAAYNSAESAADIEDLRRILKLDKINLWGLSYSSRLMLNVMRDYPNGIRSVVLESSLPPEVNYDEVGVDGIVYALNQVFKNCKLDAECAKAYTNLENEFYDVVSRLNKEPIVASVKDEKTGEANEIKLDGNDFVTWIVDYLLSDNASAIADVPMVVNQTFQGNYGTFKRYANAKTGTSGGLGMRYSVWCGEEIPFEDMRKIKAQSFIYPRLKGYEVMSLPDICSVWKVPAAKPIENKPVKSDIPTMVLTAEYDAYTPPAWGRSIAQNLKNSFLFEVPWVGHGPAFSVPCVREMIASFVDNPKSPPNSECLVKIRRDYRFVVKEK
ncbi:MAG: alpha/beta hydrolase [Acidobacteriota bacterium]|nr:alpha/beta hydrolase [Acidobacteriota bacterium]